MYYASLLVKILERLGHLKDDVPRELLAEVCEPDNLVEELSARRQLQYDVVILLRLGKLDEFDDVGVVQLTHDLDLLEDIGPLRCLLVPAGIHDAHDQDSGDERR